MLPAPLGCASEIVVRYFVNRAPVLRRAAAEAPRRRRSDCGQDRGFQRLRGSAAQMLRACVRAMNRCRTNLGGGGGRVRGAISHCHRAESTGAAARVATAAIDSVVVGNRMSGCQPDENTRCIGLYTRRRPTFCVYSQTSPSGYRLSG